VSLSYFHVTSHLCFAFLAGFMWCLWDGGFATGRDEAVFFFTMVLEGGVSWRSTSKVWPGEQTARRTIDSEELGEEIECFAAVEWWEGGGGMLAVGMGSERAGMFESLILVGTKTF